MKTNIGMEKEVVVNAPDEIGVMSRVSSVLAQAQINIKALCAYAVDNDAHVRLITEDNKKAVNALKKAGFKTTEHEVMRCEVSPHILHTEIGGLLNGFEVENNYWCAAAHSGEHAVMYFPLKGTVHPSNARIS
jgi:hypothetical protein